MTRGSGASVGNGRRGGSGGDSRAEDHRISQHRRERRLDRLPRNRLGGADLLEQLGAANLRRRGVGSGRQVILVNGAVTSLALCAEAVGILSGAAVWLLVVLAALQGATIPPISASMRSLWSRLVPEDTLESAFAFDAIQLELVFVIGPLIAAGLATALSPAVGMFLCAGFYLIASLGFATAPAARSVAQEADAERTRAGALRSPGMRTLVFAGGVTAVSFGALEVALPAFAEEEGSRGAVGPLITIWALGSVIGGLWYGARSWTSSVEKRFLILMVLLALGSAPLPFAPSIGVMGVLLVLTGFALAPLATTEYALVVLAGARWHPDRGLFVADRCERDGRSGRLTDRRPARRGGERRVGARHRRHRVRGRCRRGAGRAEHAPADCLSERGLGRFAQRLRLGQGRELAQGSLLDLASALARELEQLGDLARASAAPRHRGRSEAR